MKPIDAVIKVNMCEFCGGCMTNEGIPVFACSKQNPSNYTEYCTKEDYLRCPLNEHNGALK